MNENKYRIVSYGNIATGRNREEVIEKVRKLCKFDEQKLTAVFGGRRFVFKSGIDSTTARRYLAALGQTGLVCKVETENPAAPTESDQTCIMASAPAREIVCPKCGCNQPQSEVCQSCQVVIAKYRPPQSGYVPVEAELAAMENKKTRGAGAHIAKAMLVLLLVVGLGSWLLIARPFASKAGELDTTSGHYSNHHFKFALNYPADWNSYSVDEAIQCSTIRREYADEYLLLISPTNPDHCLLVVNISGITRDYFESKGWDAVVQLTEKRRPVLYRSVDQINGFTVYRVGYNIAQSYREDAYFEANGTMIQAYFYVKRSFDTSDRAAQMRHLIEQNLKKL